MTTADLVRKLALIFCLIPFAASADPIRLVVWGVESGAETKDRDAKIAEFQRRYPDIHVSALSMGAGSMNPQKLMTAVVGGVPPDVVLQDRFAVGDWASRGAFRPLDDLLKEDAASKSPFAIRQSEYVQATWAETQYQGKTYAIPEGTDDRVLFYNKSMFHAAGLDPNKPPRTWAELNDDAKKLTIRSGGGYRQLGFIPVYGQGWLYLWSWQQDGELMSPDGRRCTMDNPQTVKALRTVVDWYDQLGGVDSVNAFASGFGGDEQDPFMTGKLAMEVNGDGFLASIARYHPEIDFGVAPAPVPADRFNHVGRFAKDPTWVTWSGGFSYVIPLGAHHTREAWKFIQWMNSPEGQLIGAKAQKAWTESRGRLFIPYMCANTKANAAVVDYVAPSLPAKFLAAMRFAEDLLQYTKFRPVTFVGQRLWDEQVRALDQAVRHNKTPEQALAFGQSRVQAELDRTFSKDRYPALPTGLFAMVGLGLALAGIIGVSFVLARWARKRSRSERNEAWAAFGFASPWIIGFAVLTLFPIIASLLFAFCDYDVLHAPRWAGMENFQSLMTLDGGLMLKSLGNAIYLAAIGIPLSMTIGLGLAMMVNTNVRGQHFYRTFFYMPSIVPAVATSVLWIWLLNSDPSRGLIDAFWQETLTRCFHLAPPGWLSVPAWSKPALILMGAWGAGGGMILWLAGLQSVPRSLYEAAAIDGATPLLQFRHITLPMLSPYIFFNLIMGTIGALQTFESAYILGGTTSGQNTGPDDSLLVPVVYLFNNAFQYFRMGYASAIAWILFILILGLTLGQLKLAPRWVHYEVETK